MKKAPLLDKAQEGSLIAMSNDLILKSQWPPLNINEQRLVLYILALIDKRDNDFKPYRISIKELGNILGTARKDLYTQFDKATNGLMTKIIRWIEAPYTEDETLHKVTWCSHAAMTKGKGFVQISFDPHLRPFLLALKGYFTIYELRAVIRLKNHYSLRLYQFLKFNQGMGRKDGRTTALAPFEWLREYLGADSEAYTHYGHFKSKVLRPAQKDIHAKTDILFDFVQHKEGRRVTCLEFSWRNNPDYDQMEMPFLHVPEQEPKQPTPPLAALPESEYPVSRDTDAITRRLKDLGFDDWKKVREHLSDDDWHTAFADLDYHIQQKGKSGREVTSPGGWLRSRLKLSQSGQPYRPTEAYQKHRKTEQALQQRVRRQAAREAQRKRQEAEREEYDQRLAERTEVAVQGLSDTERQALVQQARDKARDILPPYSPDHGEEIEAARHKLDHLPLTEQDTLRDKAREEIQKHLAETGSALNLDSQAGQQVVQNRILQMLARDSDLQLPSQARYEEQLQRTTESMLRNLVQEKYSITGDKA